MFRDIQFGLRMLWKERSYALTAILTLAACIGANTAIFTIVHSVLLKPLPVPDSDRILHMSNRYPKMGSTIFTGSSVSDYYDRLRGMSVYEEQALYDQTGPVFYIDGTPREHSGNGSDTFGVPAFESPADSWAPLRRIGRTGRQRYEGHPQLWSVAATLWRRSRRHRTADSHGWFFSHHRRSDAARLPVCRSSNTILDTADLH